jgi:hypothetical protein
MHFYFFSFDFNALDASCSFHTQDDSKTYVIDCTKTENSEVHYAFHQPAGRFYFIPKEGNFIEFTAFLFVFLELILRPAGKPAWGVSMGR